MMIFDPPGIAAPSSEWRDYATFLQQRLGWVSDRPEDALDKQRIEAELARARVFATTSLTDSHHYINQPRDPGGEGGGQWVSEGGEDGGIVKLTPETKASVHEKNKGKTVEEIRLEAAANQIALRALGQEMQEGLGVTFSEPPKGFEVKSLDSINRKLKDGEYDGPHQLMDISRATFVVDTADKADLAIGALAARGKVLDRGWTKDSNSGYAARFVYVQHPNGGVSEIQIVPDGVAQIKMGTNLQSNGIGHQLYEVMRDPAQPMFARQAAARKSRTMYHRVMHKSFYAVTGTKVGRDAAAEDENENMTELFEYDARLYEITDGSSGYVWQSGEWRKIAPALAGEVWADGSKNPNPKDFGADMKAPRK